jgi:hypothetical protein
MLNTILLKKFDPQKTVIQGHDDGGVGFKGTQEHTSPWQLGDYEIGVSYVHMVLLYMLGDPRTYSFSFSVFHRTDPHI